MTYPDLPAVPYRAWCRQRLQRRLFALSTGARAAVEQTLAAHGCLEPLLAEGEIPSGYSEDPPPPLCRPRQVSAGERLVRLFTGISKW